LGAEGVSYDDDVSKVSVVGAGMATQVGVANQMFRTLAEQGINIQMISTSEIKISVLVARDLAVEALRTVHEAFRLHEEPPEETQLPEPLESPAATAANGGAVISRLERLEGLLIDDISLDLGQARVTVQVPDMPGLAAQVFDEIAEAGIFVDMIVQSIGRNERAHISFTVDRKNLESSLAVLNDLTRALETPPPTSSPKVAKLSVVGLGMRSHTAMASRMFRCLAEAGINVDMIPGIRRRDALKARPP